MPSRRLDQTASLTAQFNAWQRAAESMQRGGLLDDPQSGWFVTHPLFRLGLTSPTAARWGLRLLDRWCGGLHAHIIMRRRVSDHELRVAAASGITQLVVLGAGFDTSSQHLGSLPVTVFEVDTPSTQRDKRRLLEHQGVQPRWAPCDFERDDLTASLRAAGFDSAAPALVVWLGVTYYLTTPALESTLTKLTNLCAPGSRLVMDYGDPDIVGHDSPRPMVRRVSKSVTRRGEPYRTGMTAAHADELLARHGFQTVTHQRVPGLLDRYDPMNKRRLARGDWNAVLTAQRV
ncbi:putative S-adenosyl-L-methionine-dependent methyltransferase [Mycobacteroides salmoniphilum]|uniref:S-adenosyl-L-methionine-dependent methyltransferase n=1 Tax=Mycobacteroides salmoniphilum TaxID=404941 RepID=A0A4R8S272_9MYCO|nr:SAM-dependent methyltransferase [Mycobacteroides salmoniphilum]TDZ79873.1 putative S-adenosyl-L-methionine-dependent methyltransferase [Mycobacteroides salmoniphilum]